MPEISPRTHTHQPNLLNFTQLCVFTSSFGWVAVRAAHITLRSHESADAAYGSFRLCESKKRLGRRIRRSGSGTLHLFSHPVSPTLSDPRARSFACFCSLQRREWTVSLITAIMYLRNNFNFSAFSQQMLHAQTCTKSSEGPERAAYRWRRVQSKAGCPEFLFRACAGCWWVSAASQRWWWGEERIKRVAEEEEAQSEVEAFYLDHMTQSLFSSPFFLMTNSLFHFNGLHPRRMRRVCQCVCVQKGCLQTHGGENIMPQIPIA